jgi:hypothetical protein
VEWRNGGRGSEREPGGGIERERGALGRLPPHAGRRNKQTEQREGSQRERVVERE